MHPVHIFISIVNILCLIAVAMTFSGHAGSHAEALVTYGVFFGYFANSAAIISAALVLLLVLIRIIRRSSTNSLKRHWLGLANGGVVLLFYGVLFTWR